MVLFIGEKNMNQIVIYGKLGKQPELRYSKAGKPFCTASVATSERVKDASGQWVDSEPTWHNIIAHGYEAEKLACLSKGSGIVVFGKITVNKSTSKDGVERIYTNILASKIVPEFFINPRENSVEKEEVSDDEIPF